MTDRLSPRAYGYFNVPRNSSPGTWIFPNARRIKVERAVVRCVNPTEAMIETFRQVSIGSCASTLPEKQRTAFFFAKRCDYLGPVKTLISVESETAYVETNETIGSSPRKRDRESTSYRRLRHRCRNSEMQRLRRRPKLAILGPIERETLATSIALSDAPRDNGVFPREWPHLKLIDFGVCAVALHLDRGANGPHVITP